MGICFLGCEGWDDTMVYVLGLKIAVGVLGW